MKYLKLRCFSKVYLSLFSNRNFNKYLKFLFKFVTSMSDRLSMDRLFNKISLRDSFVNRFCPNVKHGTKIFKFDFFFFFFCKSLQCMCSIPPKRCCRQRGPGSRFVLLQIVFILEYTVVSAQHTYCMMLWTQLGPGLKFNHKIEFFMRFYTKILGSIKNIITGLGNTMRLSKLKYKHGSIFLNFLLFPQTFKSIYISFLLQLK